MFTVLSLALAAETGALLGISLYLGNTLIAAAGLITLTASIIMLRLSKDKEVESNDIRG